MVIANIGHKRRFGGTPPEQLLDRKLQFHTGNDRYFPDLVSMIEECPENQVVVIDKKYSMTAGQARTFQKYGEDFELGGELRIVKNTPDYQAIEDKLDPTGLIVSALHDNRDIHNGYAWVGSSDGGLRVATLYYCVEGAEIAALEGPGLKPERRGEHIQSSSAPSRRYKKIKHSVTISRVPFQDIGEKAYAEWLHLRSKTTVGAEQWQADARNNRKTPIYFFVPHAVALYHAAVASDLPQGDKPIINPFVIPTSKTINFVEKLRHNTVQTYIDSHNDKSYRLLGVAEKERWLWYFTIKHADRVSDAWRVDNTSATMRNAKDYLVSYEEKKKRGRK